MIINWHYMKKLAALPLILLAVGHHGSLANAGLTVDSIDTKLTEPQKYELYEARYSNFCITGSPEVFHLSDGSSWNAVGSLSEGTCSLGSESIQGDFIHYTMSSPRAGYLLNYIKRDQKSNPAYPQYSQYSEGVLGQSGPIVIDALIGSNQATMHGFLKIISNAPTSWGVFNYYSASVGQSVPFEATYSLESETWQPGIFGHNFTYSIVGHIDFTHPVPEPSTLALLLTATLGGLLLWRRRR